MSNPANPKILGVRFTMLLFLYRRRLRAHPVQELLAGAGIAVGVALVFGVLLANASLMASIRQLVRGIDGSARLALVARSPAGFPEGLTQSVRRLEGVQLATPVLRENMAIQGPGGQRSVQMIGVSPSLASLGGIAQRELGNGALLLSGGLGLPSGVAASIGAHRGGRVTLIGGGYARSERVGAVISSEAIKALARVPVAVALLPVAQRLTRRPGRVTELLIEPRAGKGDLVRGELRHLAAGRLDVESSENELTLLTQATKPNRQSTSLFAAISVMVGFLLALNAMLLTVPERRRFIAELRMQGYAPRQILLLLVFQAAILGLVASIVGVVLGDVLSHAIYHQVPAYLTVAFPVSAEQSLQAGLVLLAIGSGVVATVLASLSPALDLRPGRPADAVFREAEGGELIGARLSKRLAFVGLGFIVLVSVLVAPFPGLTVLGGVTLALVSVCLMPAALILAARLLPRLIEGSESGAVIVAASELRATTTRSVALAAIAGLAVYGSVAIGGAREDLLRGIDQAIVQYHATADIWVTNPENVFNTDNFRTGGLVAAISRAPGVGSVHVYQGTLADVGERRLWVRARPASDSSALESSQIIDGDFARAESLIRAGGWGAVSNGFAHDHDLKVGSPFALPTPSGTEHLRVAAITTNSGWPAGTITLNSTDFSRAWMTDEAAALEVELKPGTNSAAGIRAVRAALGPRTGLSVHSAPERVSEAEASARQGLRTLGQISTLLLVASALAVAAALSATVWQRRARLASLKIQGYNPRQLWQGLLLESGVMLGVGSGVGALVGVYGHALASRWLTTTTGFPAPFSIGVFQVFLTLALITAIALAVIALPGLMAARVSPSLSLQE